ncbi:MAG: hypothetical protein M3P28_08700 [Thermoproteota archaeon]|nr:hypothetical protein [Thermoproteota archaeon]
MMIKEKHSITRQNGTEEGLDLEEISYPYFDDNLNLVGSTSELRDSKGNFFAFVDFHENEGVIRECPHCLEYEIHNKLKPRILKKGEQRPPDYDLFIQCWECGTVYSLHQTFVEPEIKDSLETVKSPFESNDSIFISTDTRATTRRKKERKDGYRKGVHKYRSKRIDYEDKQDPDIQREIDRHGSENVRIIQ